MKAVSTKFYYRLELCAVEHFPDGSVEHSTLDAVESSPFATTEEEAMLRFERSIHAINAGRRAPGGSGEPLFLYPAQAPESP